MRPSSIRPTLMRGVAIFLLILIGLAIAPQTLFAQAVIRGGSLYPGEVIDNDVIMTGDAVQLSGTVKGNAFISGRDVVIDGTVEGSLFVIGQRVTINGTVGGGAYVLSISSRLGAAGSVGQNLYYLGVSFVSERGSRVGRDLVGLSLGAVLQGSVGRETRLIAGLLQFVNLFFDFALGPTPAPLVTAIAGRAPGLGQIILPGEVVIDVFGQTINTAQPPVPPEMPTQSELVLDWLMARLREFLPMLIVGLIGYWFLRDRLERSAVPIKTHPLITLGYGLVGLVLVVAVIIALLLVFFLIFMTGMWIGRTTFWNVAWLFWSIAFPLTALVFSLLMAFFNYGTKAITSYALIGYLVDRFIPRAGRHRWLLMTLGLIVYVCLRSIPTLGWVIAVLVTSWGIGGAWLAWRVRRPMPLFYTAEPGLAETAPEDAEKTDDPTG